MFRVSCIQLCSTDCDRNNLKRTKALKACKKYNAVILDETKKSFVIQVTALRREIDEMSKNLKKLGLIQNLWL